MPANAGIQGLGAVSGAVLRNHDSRPERRLWIPACAGMTGEAPSSRQQGARNRGGCNLRAPNFAASFSPPVNSLFRTGSARKIPCSRRSKFPVPVGLRSATAALQSRQVQDIAGLFGAGRRPGGKKFPAGREILQRARSPPRAISRRRRDGSDRARPERIACKPRRHGSRRGLCARPPVSSRRRRRRMSRPFPPFRPASPAGRNGGRASPQAPAPAQRRP